MLPYDGSENPKFKNEKKVRCPWCGEEQAKEYEEMMQKPDEQYQTQCKFCGNTFAVAVHAKYTYDTSRVK